MSTLTDLPLVLPGAEDRLVTQTRYFDYYRIGSKALMKHAWRLRYEVYCVERGFLRVENYPDGFETDPYDDTSVHFLGLHRRTGVPAGTVRLIRPGAEVFPLLSHCQPDPEYGYLWDPNDVRTKSCVEVSRIIVGTHFRQRADDTTFGGPPREDFPRDDAELPFFPSGAGPEIVAGLYKTTYQGARRLGMTYLLAAMERSLYLLMRRVYIRFTPIGPEEDYYGPVRPYIVAMRQMEEDLARYRPEIFKYWMDGLEPELRPPLGPDGELLPVTQSGP